MAEHSSIRTPAPSPGKAAEQFGVARSTIYRTIERMNSQG